MKKTISFILCFVLIFSNVMSIAGQNDDMYSLSVRKMESFGIMTGTPDGGIETEREITRSEFATVLIRILSLESVATVVGAGEQVFVDVPASHWAAAYVNLACELGLMIGVGDGKFEPDSDVTYEQAVKALICALGYDAIIEPDAEVWYMPYMSEAAKLKLLKNVDSSFEAGKALKRGQVALLLDNALEIEMLERQDDKYFVGKGVTLLEGLFAGGEYTGIVEATHETGLYGDEELKEDEVIIGGLKYKTGLTNASEYLGYSVEFYGNEINGNAVLASVILSDENQTMTLSGMDCVSSSRNKIEYEDENGKTKSVKLSDDLHVIYNGKVYSGYDEEIFSWPNANALLIDNNSDGRFDVAKLTVSEVQQIEHVNLYNKKIYLKGNLESGTNVIDLYDDEIEYIIESYDGTELTISDINDEDTFIEIYASYDMEKIRIIKLNDEISGQITQIYHDEEKITIDDREYDVYSTKVGSVIDFSDLKIGSFCAFVLSSDEKIVSVETDLTQGNMQYGYIYDICLKDGLKGEIEVKILKGTLTEQIKERDRYYLVSKDVQEIKIFSLAEKVKIDDVAYKSAEDQFGILSIGSVIRYALDADGKINKIVISKEMGDYGARNFNAEVQVFGGITRRAFGIDNKTVAFFLPAGSNEDDVQSAMKYTSDEYECQGFDETEEGNVAGAMIFKTDIDSDKEIYFNDDVPFCMVQAVSRCMNDDRNEYIKVSGYENGKEFVYQTVPNAPAYDVLQSAKCGDIFRFSKNFRGEIITAQKIYTGYDAKKPEHLKPDYPFYERSGTGNKQVFGIVTEAEHRALSDYSTEYENILYVSTSADGSNAEKYSLIYKESEAPYYYIYDYEKGTVVPATFKDIVSSGNSDLDSASRVFVYSLNNVVKLVMIVI